MKTADSVRWLKQQGLLDISREHYKGVKNVFSKCLFVKKEKILILADTGLKGNNLAAVLAGCFYLYAKKKRKRVELILQESKTRGDKADTDIVQALIKHPEKNIVISINSDRLGSLRRIKSFRKYCRKKMHKFITPTSLGYVPTDYITQLMATIDIDYDKLRKRQNALKKKLDKGKVVRLKTKAGTDVAFNIEEIEAISADGYYKEYGTGGNIPAGEVYLYPNEGSVSGTVVIDASSRNRIKTELVREPITIKIAKGKITKIRDGVEGNLLDESLEWAEKKAKYPERVRSIAELGIGMNPQAKIIGTTIIDEKAYDTAHIGIGSNSWFGGPIKTIIHMDQVFRNPKIYIDGKLVKY